MMITYTGIILILLFVSILILQRRQASSIHKRSQIIYNSDIHSFIALQSRIMEQIVYDYTYWDEFAEELERGISQKWLNENITTLLDAYDFCYVAVYDKNYRLIYESSTDSLNLTKIVPKEALESISEVKSGHFFIESENSFLEISSGAVRPVQHWIRKPSILPATWFLHKTGMKVFWKKSPHNSTLSITIPKTPNLFTSNQQHKQLPHIIITTGKGNR